MQLTSNEQIPGLNPGGTTKKYNNKMEVFEEIHNEFINSEEYYVFLRRLEEEQENYLKKLVN